MNRLAALLHMFIGSSLAGVAIVAILVAQIASLWTLIGGAILGYLVAIPVSVILAKRLDPD